jgi:transposase
MRRARFRHWIGLPRFFLCGLACRSARHTTTNDHGTTTLFAAFNILNGKVIGTCQDRHRSREFIRFLHQPETELPTDREVHLIMDNYCTHKSAEVQRWLKPKKRNRFHFHFTPTSSSWLNQVERFFALITERMIRRGTFHSTEELGEAIYKRLATWNGEPAPFIWRASADVILDKVRRCKELSKTGDSYIVSLKHNHMDLFPVTLKHGR